MVCLTWKSSQNSCGGAGGCGTNTNWFWWIAAAVGAFALFSKGRKKGAA